MSERQQRLVFGEDAELYDRARPAYPDAAIDAVVAMAGPPAAAPRRAVEVGAGTGKATAAVAARGVRVTAVEPDPGMAAVLRRNVAGLANVDLALGGFEEWEPGPVAYDLVYSGQAWHWIDPARRYGLAAAALRPGGGLALFWHRTRWPDGDPVRAELDELYRRHAPGLHAREPGSEGNAAGRPGHGDPVGESTSSGWFEDPSRIGVPWTATYDAAGYAELLCTQSDHRLADPDAIEALVDAVTAFVQGRGGSIEIPYETVLFTARRVGG